VKPAKLLGVIAMSAWAAGCASLQPFPPMLAAQDLRHDGVAQPQLPVSDMNAATMVARQDLYATTERAVRQLADSVAAPLHGAQTLVTTITDVNRISTAAPLGRTLAEHVATAWVAKGFKVREVRMRDHLLLDEAQGEMMLSRKAADVAATQGAELVVTGTYAAAARVTYVSLKVLRASNGFVEAAVSYELPHSPDVLKLLQTASR
jgi:hypothetical protein